MGNQDLWYHRFKVGEVVLTGQGPLLVINNSYLESLQCLGKFGIPNIRTLNYLRDNSLCGETQILPVQWDADP